MYKICAIVDKFFVCACKQQGCIQWVFKRIEKEWFWYFPLSTSFKACKMINDVV